MSLPLQNPPDRLCLIRLSAIGDTCHTLPIVRTLQQAWPQTQLTWIIGRIEAGLMGDIEGVEFIIFDKRRSGALRELRRALGGRRFPVLLHMHASMRANRVSMQVRADVRLGFDRARARDWQWLFTNHRIAARPRQHVMDGLFGFTEALGISERALRWDIPLSAADREFAGEQLPEGTRHLVISPCSSQRFRNFRNWRVENYVAVIDHAWQAHGVHTVLTGGPTELERDYAARILAQSRAPVRSLVGETTLKQLLAVLARADAVLCPDSGPAHMATTVGTPVVGLYATSNRLRTGPYFSQHLVADRYPDAVRKSLRREVEDLRWGGRVRTPDAMDLITIEDVTTRLALALAEGRHGPAAAEI